MLTVCMLEMHYAIRIIYRQSSSVHFKSAFSYNVHETAAHRCKQKHHERLSVREKPKN